MTAHPPPQPHSPHAVHAPAAKPHIGLTSHSAPPAHFVRAKAPTHGLATPHLKKSAHTGHTQAPATAKTKAIPQAPKLSPTQRFIAAQKLMEEKIAQKLAAAFTSKVSKFVSSLEYDARHQPRQKLTPQELEQVKLAVTVDIPHEETRFKVLHRYDKAMKIFARIDALQEREFKNAVLVNSGLILTEAYKKQLDALNVKNVKDMQKLCTEIGNTPQQMEEYYSYLKANPQLSREDGAYAMDKFGAKEDFTNQDSSALGAHQLLAPTVKDLLERDWAQFKAEYPTDPRIHTLVLYGQILDLKNLPKNERISVVNELKARGQTVGQLAKQALDLRADIEISTILTLKLAIEYALKLKQLGVSVIRPHVLIAHVEGGRAAAQSLRVAASFPQAKISILRETGILKQQAILENEAVFGGENMPIETPLKWAASWTYGARAPSLIPAEVGRVPLRASPAFQALARPVTPQRVSAPLQRAIRHELVEAKYQTRVATGTLAFDKSAVTPEMFKPGSPLTKTGRDIVLIGFGDNVVQYKSAHKLTIVTLR